MAKIRKVRVSATIRPDQKVYLENVALVESTSIADLLVDLLDDAIAERERRARRMAVSA